MEKEALIFYAAIREARLTTLDCTASAQQYRRLAARHIDYDVWQSRMLWNCRGPIQNPKINPVENPTEFLGIDKVIWLTVDVKFVEGMRVPNLMSLWWRP